MNLNRREILKLSSLAALANSPFHFSSPELRTNNNSSAPNVLFIVFDALSALNCSIYGYQRQTTPLLEKLSQKAVVYHNHYAGGIYTTPGTASLLTGTLPWTNRAINPHDPVIKSLADRNIFNLFADDYYRLAYTHNPLADVLLRQFIPYMEKFIPREDLFLSNYWVSQLFKNDFNIAFIAALNAIEDYRTVIKSSIYASEANDYFLRPQQEKAAEPYKPLFPRGLPNVRDKYFILEDGIDWLINNNLELPEPYMGYFHFLPPHEPYNTRKDFINRYLGDGYEPLQKPEHQLSAGRSYERLVRDLRMYDEFINYVDFEFNRLMENLQNSGALDNTWVILTSDHGEMFERGILGHDTVTMFQPLVRVPLIIFPPGQQERIDIHVPTSAVDLVPTLLHAANKDIPEWLEGTVLPPFSGQQPETLADRSIYAFYGHNSNQANPIHSYSGMLLKQDMKLVEYRGYGKLEDQGQSLELYDVNFDPEEMNNLAQTEQSTTEHLLAELTDTFNRAEAPYT